MRISPVGITAALCVLGAEIAPEVSRAVYALAVRVRRERLPGVVELVPAFASLLVRFDPCVTCFSEVSDVLFKLQESPVSEEANAGRLIEIPVCYGGEYGPDLPFVARHAGLREDEVIRLHSGAVYPIYMIGFLPGFPYLGGLDPRLYTPRLSAPRKRIPAGSVGIGGQQTGVYPMESPGGWQLIGRTPMKLFDPDRPPRYRAGDSIRFVPVSPECFAMEAGYGD